MVGYWGLDLEGAAVEGSILIGKKATITEGLNLRGATIGTFELFGEASVQEHGEFGVAIHADYATFERTLDIGDSAVVVGGIELRHAHAGVLTLRDYLAWPKGRVVLDGLTYDRFASSATFLETDPVRWLERQRPDQLDPFRPQPWEQCATTLKAMGDDEEARRFQIEKERAWRAARRRRRPIWQRAGLAAYDTVLDWTIRFGYRPSRAGLWLLAFLLLGWLCFAWVAPDPPGVPPRAVALVPASEHPPVFQPLVFAVDSFVPVLGLGMADGWRPSDAPEAWWLRWFVWVYKLFGWALAGFWIAGFTGLVKK